MIDDKVSRQAKRDLEKVSEEGGLLSSPKLRMKSNSFIGHFQARDIDENDPVELWGTRIARSLSLIAFIALAYWLYITYLQH